MSRSFLICLTMLVLACPVFANSVKAFEDPDNHPHFATYSHREIFSSREDRLWETSSLRKRFDFDDSEKKKVHFFHRSEREDCDWDPDPSVGPPVVSAVPEVPTAWLLLLGTITLLGSGRLRSVFARRS